MALPSTLQTEIFQFTKFFVFVFCFVCRCSTFLVLKMIVSHHKPRFINNIEVREIKKSYIKSLRQEIIELGLLFPNSREFSRYVL